MGIIAVIIGLVFFSGFLGDLREMKAAVEDAMARACIDMGGSIVDNGTCIIPVKYDCGKMPKRQGTLTLQECSDSTLIYKNTTGATTTLPTFQVPIMNRP